MRRHEYVAKEITDEQVVSLIKKVEEKGTDWNRGSRNFKDKKVKDVFYDLQKTEFSYEEKCIAVKEFFNFITFKGKGKEIEI